jgi:tetratricopeptide (TPR) repeat protein
MRAFCMEELCFILKEHAYLLDSSLMNDELLEWIDEECGRKELARSLYPLVHRQGSLSAFVGAILDSVGFYDRKIIAATEQIVKQNAGLSIIEKRKSQVDRLVEKKKYRAACREYDRLLGLWREDERSGGALPAVSCLGAILHNKGVALTGLMLYGEAAECFKEAWERTGDEEEARAYLAAKRMELPDRDYVAFAAENGKLFRKTMELEKEIEALYHAFEEQPEYLQLNGRRELKEEGDLQKYDEESDRVIQTMKDSYRDSCGS